jgi:hypothetical protein
MNKKLLREKYNEYIAKPAIVEDTAEDTSPHNQLMKEFDATFQTKSEKRNVWLENKIMDEFNEIFKDIK